MVHDHQLWKHVWKHLLPYGDQTCCNPSTRTCVFWQRGNKSVRIISCIWMQDMIPADKTWSSVLCWWSWRQHESEAWWQHQWRENHHHKRWQSTDPFNEWLPFYGAGLHGCNQWALGCAIIIMAQKMNALAPLGHQPLPKYSTWWLECPIPSSWWSWLTVSAVFPGICEHTCE